MTWNHRITRRRVPSPRGPVHVYEIREVYYGTEDGSLSWTEDPVGPVGESARDLLDDLAILGRVAERPVLDLDTREDVPLRECWTATTPAHDPAEVPAEVPGTADGGAR